MSSEPKEPRGHFDLFPNQPINESALSLVWSIGVVVSGVQCILGTGSYGRAVYNDGVRCRKDTILVVCIWVT